MDELREHPAPQPDWDRKGKLEAIGRALAKLQKMVEAHEAPGRPHND